MRVPEGESSPRGCIDALVPLTLANETPQWLAFAARAGGVWSLPISDVEPRDEPEAAPAITRLLPEKLGRVRALAFHGACLWAGRQDGGLNCHQLRPSIDGTRVEAARTLLDGFEGPRTFSSLCVVPGATGDRMLAGVYTGAIFEFPLAGSEGQPSESPPERRAMEEPVRVITPVCGLDDLARRRQEAHGPHPDGTEAIPPAELPHYVVATASRVFSYLGDDEQVRCIAGEEDTSRGRGVVLGLSAFVDEGRWSVAYARTHGGVDLVERSRDEVDGHDPRALRRTRLRLDDTSVFRVHLEYLPKGGGTLLVIGTGTNQLRCLLRREAGSRRPPGAVWGDRLDGQGATPTELGVRLGRLRRVCERNPFDERVKEGAAATLAAIDFRPWCRALDEARLAELESMVYHLAFRAPPTAFHDLLRALNRLAAVIYDQSDDQSGDQTAFRHVVDLRRFVEKYCDGGRSFSRKSGRRTALVFHNAEVNPEDAHIYRADLAYRGLDVLFDTKARTPGEFGETSCLLPLWCRGDQKQVPARPARFLLCTHKPGVISLFTWQGERIPAHLPAPEAYVDSVFVGGQHVYLFASSGETWRVPTATLLKAEGTLTAIQPVPLPAGDEPTPEGHQRVFAVCPGFDEQPGEALDSFFFADDEGRIGEYRRGSYRGMLEGEGGTGHAVRGLRSVRRRGRQFLFAACDDGRLRVYEVIRGGPSPGTRSTVRRLHQLWLGPHPVLALSPLLEDEALMAAATSPGYVYAIRLLPVDGQPAHGAPPFALRVAWTYRTAGRVRSLAWFRFAERVDGAPRTYLALGSLDEHLHVLDRAGRCVNTVHLHGVPVSRLWVGPELSEQRQEGLLADVRIAAHEDRFLGGRYVLRHELLRRVREAIPAHASSRFPERCERERLLLRWRAMNLEEPLLCITYCLHSARFRDRPDIVLAELERLLGGKVDLVSTSHMIGLVRALFRRGWPTRLLDTGNDERYWDHYERAVALLREAVSRWGVSGEHDNIKLQLYWVRSLLRGIESAAQFNRWARTTRDERRPLRVRTHLQHFTQHDQAFVRHKTLGYLEDLLFGRATAPDSDNGLLGGEPEGLRRAELVEHALDILFDCVGWNRNDLRPGSAYWVTDRACSILARMLAAGREPLCPAYLVYRTRKAALSPVFFRRLAEVLEAWEPVGDQGLNVQRYRDMCRCAALVRNAGEMVDLLALDGDRKPPELEAGDAAKLSDVLAQHVEYCEGCLSDNGACPRDPYREETRGLLAFAVRQMQRRTLERFVSSDATIRQPLETQEGTHYPRDVVETVVEHLRRLDSRLQRYYETTNNDIYGLTFTHFRATDILELERLFEEALSAMERERDEHGEENRRFVAALGTAVVRCWQSVLVHQEREGLLTDFLRAAARIELEPRSGLAGLSAQELGAEPPQDDAPYQRAFPNLFARLFASSEADRAYLLLHDRRQQDMELLCLDRDAWTTQYAANAVRADESLPLAPPTERPSDDWPLPYDWQRQDAFQQAGEEELRGGFANYLAAAGSHWKTCHVVPLVERLSPRDKARNHGVMGFFWKQETQVPPQLTVLPSTWLHGLALGRALEDSLESQSNVFRIIGHNLRSPMLNALRDANRILTSPELSSDNREDLVELIRNRARRVLGQCDAVLFLSGVPLKPQPKSLDIVSLVGDAMRLARRQAQYLGLDIQYWDALTPPLVEAESDESMLWEVFCLVLDNAVKYTNVRAIKERCVPEPVVVRVESDKRHAVITVSDDGIGMDPGDFAVAQKAFQRGARAERLGVKGLGIGLFTARVYLQALRGGLKLSPRDSGGIDCRIKVPRQFLGA